MLSPLAAQIIVGLLAAIALFAVIYVLFYTSMTGDRSSSRIEGAALGTSGRQARKSLSAATEALNTRKKQVQDSIADMEAREKAKKKVNLRVKLQRAGIEATTQQFWIASAIAGVGIGAIVFLSGSSPLISILAAFGGAFGLPNWVLNFLFKRRKLKFVQEFANSIDVIVRGIKSGLPLNDCMRMIGQEAPDPVGGEFRQIIESQKVGVTLDECLKKFYERMPLAEVNFFQIVLSIQQKAGGNLSEALSNLSGVLRERKRLQGKIKALSSEAKSSAAIIGALPVLMMVLVYLTTPQYIMPLFTERLGNIFLAGSAGWMFLGILVMRKMISFKI